MQKGAERVRSEVTHNDSEKMRKLEKERHSNNTDSVKKVARVCHR